MPVYPDKPRYIVKVRPEDRDKARLTFRLPKDHHYYNLIGRVASTWSLFEFALDRVIWELADNTPADLTLCLTGNLMGATPRFKIIQALGKRAGLPDKALKPLRQFQNKEVYRVGDDRNRIVHDPWFLSVKLSDFANEVSQLKTHGYEPVSEDHMLKVIRETNDLITRVGELHEQLRDALRALRDKPDGLLPTSQPHGAP